MTRSKAEVAEWQSHHDELKALWLDQGWNAMQIQNHMSQTYSFCKSESQYTRQFKKWGFRKNATDEEWKFVAYRQAKRKREGKDPGRVYMKGKRVPDPKARKEAARHALLSSQYLEPGPMTPEGVFVGTPQSELNYAVSEDFANTLAMDWDPGLDVTNPGVSTLFQHTDGNSLEFPIDLPAFGSSESLFGLTDAGLARPLPTSTFTGMATSPGRNGHIQSDPDSLNSEVVEQARLALLQQFPTSGDRNHNNVLAALEPITLGDANGGMVKVAEAIFQSPSSEKLSHYLNVCIYLSSNNMMSQRSTDNLVSLVAKSGSHSRLKSLLNSTTTTIEIFMSNLLASAASVGEAEICRTLIEAGADLDAPSGLGMRTTALHRAVMCKKTACARMLLEAGADPNVVIDGRTPLHHACCQSNSLDLVRLLLEFGAHVNPPQDTAQLTPLQLAVTSNEPDLVQLLLDRGASPNSFTSSKHGTALQIACNSCADAKIVEILIASGADIDSRPGYRNKKQDSGYLESGDEGSESEEGPDEDYLSGTNKLPSSLKPAILIAAERENWEAVQLLLEEGAAVNASLGKCPPRVLNWELDDYILHPFDSPTVFTPLQAAVRAQNITMTRMLLSAGAHIDARPDGKQGHTALQICAMVGHERLAGILLAKGADVNAPAGVYHGWTALQAAAVHSDTTLLSMLLREGADVNAPPAKAKGKTALQMAVSAGNTESVRLLLDAKAAVNTNPNLTDGGTALHEALRIKDSAIRDEILHLLRRAGANIHFPEKYEDYAPLHTAVSEGDLEMTRKLLKEGASPNSGFCTFTECTPLQLASTNSREDLVQLLIDHGADVNAQPHRWRGRTALQSAASHGNIPLVKMLLRFGAKIKSQRAAVEGISAIEAAAEYGVQEIVQLFLDKEPDAISSDPVTRGRILELALGGWKCDVALLELLIKGGADVDSAPSSPSKMPFFQLAVQWGNFRMVQYLVTAGANVNGRRKINSPGNVTALQAAVSSRNIDIVRLLLSIESRADVNAPANEHGGKTALQLAVSQNYRAMVQLLMDHGADVNGLPSAMRGRTALQEAASSGFVQLTQHLLAHGAHVNAPAARVGGVTALQGAAIQGNIRIVMALLQAGADINGAPAIEQGRHAIEGAAENGRLDTLHLLLNYHPDTEEFQIKKKRAAKLALAHGHLAIGRFLLAYRKPNWNR